MELFLNFVWVLLFLPAAWMWRRSRGGPDSTRCFWTLACALVLLFPVISATDDLHAAPQAMEESSSSKRSLKHGNLARSQNHISTPPVLIALVFANTVVPQTCFCVLNPSFVFPEAPASGIVGNRAPPSESLSTSS